jgi:hypothetical protein
MQKSKKKIEPIPEEFKTIMEASDSGISMLSLIIE